MIKTKIKVIKTVGKYSNRQILGCVPIEPNDKIVFNKYKNFTLVDELLVLTEGKTYTVEMKEKDSNYGKQYQLISVPSFSVESVDNITDDMELELLSEITTGSIIGAIHDVYPNYVRLILQGKKDEIDLTKIKGVKDYRHNLYCRLINEKFKYYHIIDQLRKYQIELKDCKALVNMYPTVEGILKSMEDNPYYCLISICGWGFEKADGIILYCRPELATSEIRAEFALGHLLTLNEREGHTYMSMDTAKVTLGGLATELLEKLDDIAENSELIYYDKEDNSVAFMSTYLAECNIADFITTKLKNSTSLDIDYTKYSEVDGFKLTDNQTLALKNFCDSNISLLVGYAGSGKAQPIDTIIPTPNGKMKLCDLKVGEYVYDRLGKPTKILGIYPQGIKDCYTVTLADGRQTKCNDEHLWTYITNKGSMATKTLRQMIDSGILIKDNRGRYSSKYKIPCCAPVEMSTKQYRIDPYVLGSFLGNGCCLETQLTISSNDIENITEISKIISADYERRHISNYNWRFISKETNKPIKTKEFFKGFEKHICCYSYDKSIPEEYKYGSINQRLSLLQGLFDTDGSICVSQNRFNISYSSTSKQLIEDMKDIIFSLGYSCSIREDNRAKSKRTCYILNLNIANTEKPNIFRIKRKKDIANTSLNYKKNRDYCKIGIRAVEKDDKPQEMLCIYVENDEHLYLTNDYIVTHNTSSMKSLVRLLEDNNLSYVLLAPTGKASGKLSEATGKPASTMHRAIASGGITQDVVIIDEWSFFGTEWTTMLINGILNDNARIVFVGDNAQLPSISHGKVFQDMIDSELIPTTMLTEIFRYGEGGIMQVATDIRNGKQFLTDAPIQKFGNDYTFIQSDNPKETLIEEYTKLINKGVKPSDIMCLSPYNIGQAGCFILNNELQVITNPPKPNEISHTFNIKRGGSTYPVTLRKGDNVINIKNDYEALPYSSWDIIEWEDGVTSEDVPTTTIYNGDCGTIVNCDKNKIVVKFGEELIVYNKSKMYNLLLSSVISTHKSQGSQAPYVIDIISPLHSNMHSRNLQYVATTRASKQYIEIGSVSEMNKCLLKQDNKERRSKVMYLLKEKMNERSNSN